MSDWICRKCGVDSYGHSLSSSKCVWDPIDSDWLADHDRAVEARGFAKGWNAIEVEYRDGVGEINPINGEPISRVVESDG